LPSIYISYILNLLLILISGRNARNAAILDIRVFTIAPRRRNDDSSEAASSTLPLQKLVSKN